MSEPDPTNMDIDKKPDVDTSFQEDSEYLPNNDTKTENESFDRSELTEDNQASTDKSYDDNTDQTNSRKSRELKSLLALSKEANLKTNISHKRKKDLKDCSRGNFSDTESKKPVKMSSEPKHNFRFPVTAEAELEELQENEPKIQNEAFKPNRKRRDTSSDRMSLDDNKRNKKIAYGDIKIFKPNKDVFCWRCHREGVNVVCETCPRSYHQKCLKQTIMDVNHWPCPECVAILRAESTHTRSAAMKGMTLEHLCSLLKFAVIRMIQCQGSEPFLHPVSDTEFPEYKKYIIQPMDLTMLEKNIKDNIYGSTQAFEADAKWLLHNSIIFNSYQSKLTSAAKSMIKICKQEMLEIENCPSCYLKANVNKSTWFVEVCPVPHILVWAKLKGFPYWPAKAMSLSSTGMVDVRFFGAHDRAWVHWRECFLYSEKDPNTFKQKRFDIEKCVEELNVYIDNLKKIYGEFRYAPFRTPVDPENFAKQLLIFLPKYKSVISKRKSYRASSETKLEDLDESKLETPTKDESTNEEKFESSRSDSNFTSPVPDHDNTMEGYGTDDDMQSEIDIEGRRAFADKKDDIEGNEDEEELDDTQMPSNISADVLPRGKVRTRGGFNSSSGKLKILPRHSTDNCVSSEERSTTPRKMSRRNSDQSVKSDSSRVSNISDKINRVNISENMEITLGNEDVGCVTISENISPPNGESSSSGSENSVEIKKKPVQVDIDNAEFSISPNKVKISDQIIRRLTDVQKIEEVKKNLKENSDSLSQICEPSPSTSKNNKIDNINGNSEHVNLNTNKDVINNHELMESLISKKETDDKSKNLKVIQPSIKEFMTVKHKFTAENDNSKLKLNEHLSITEENEAAVAETVGDIPEKMDIDRTEKDTEVVSLKQKPLEKEKNDASLEKDVNVEQELVKNNKVSSSEPSSNSDKIKLDDKHLKLNKSEEVSVVLVRTKDTSNSKAKISEASEKMSAIKNSTKTPNVSNSETSETVSKPENEITSVISIRNVKDKEAELLEKKLPEKSNNKSLNKELSNIIQEFDEDDEPHTQNLIMDKKNILNVIHSSLNLAKKLTISTENITTSVNQIDKNIEISNNQGNETEQSKKRKLSTDEASSPTKLVKLVSIESILNKKDKDDKMNQIEKDVDSRIVDKQAAPVVESNLQILPEDIKSEPESDEEMEEAQHMEEKRKYLSALNIHEKTAELEKIEKNEIRTRSKAEEKRERFKVVDNLTRIIDDVAMNYSAKHEGEKIPQRKPEKRKSTSGFPLPEGEIFVKSFARLQNPPPGKQKARKTFPVPPYVKGMNKNTIYKKDVSLLRREVQPQKVPSSTGNKTAPVSTAAEKSVTSSPINTISTSRATTLNSTAVTHSVSSSGSTPPTTSISVVTPTSMSVASSSLNIIPSTSLGLVTPSSISLIQTQKGLEAPHQSMTMSHVILVPGSAVNYCSPVLNTSTLPTPALTACPPSTQAQSILKSIIHAPNLKTSQNYIPHNDDTDAESPSPPTTNNVMNGFVNQQPITPQTSQQRLPETSESNTPSTSSEPVRTTSATPTIVPNDFQEDEFAVLNGIIPENVSRAVSELLLRPPPRMKPRPPGITNQVFDEGIPSTAGDVTAKINSISHRMTDYFRGMLIETLEDLGKAVNPEAKITCLQMELEAVKHRHNLEMTEIRKNMCSILKDIQRSIVDEREKIIDETRASCEAETIRRVELAKSKQWCANCPREAQFYCCWNTSYCDYPCQQKHWPQHAGKCTQSIEKATATGTAPPPRPPVQPIVLRPAGPTKPGMGRIITKQTKVYMNRTNTPHNTVKTVPTSGLTLVETTPGNYELLGNGPVALAGKIYTANTKFKGPPSSTVGTSPRIPDPTRQTTSSDNNRSHNI